MRVDNGLTRVLDPAHVTDYLEFAAGLAAPAAPGCRRRTADLPRRCRQETSAASRS
jgi:hypothetical protein